MATRILALITRSIPFSQIQIRKMEMNLGPGIHGHVLKQNSSNLVWVDLEMIGLDIDKDHILEISCIITDKDLKVLAEAPTQIIHHSEEILKSMNQWCIEHHGKSGLTEAVRSSPTSLQQAEDTMVEFIQKYTAPGKCPLAGNTVHEDGRFLKKYMPRFMQHLHYRIVDVSSIKELCRRWYPEVSKQTPAKAESHRALDDIRESIRELAFYREELFK